jgi:hypothetical protein
VNILDIDIDLFVDPRPWRKAADRLSPTEYQPWSIQAVETYLTERCGLKRDYPLPGAIVAYHHEVFDCWKKLTASGQLETPFQLTHLDSHADMGMGDGSCGYIMGDLLYREAIERQNPRRDGITGLLEGNYVSFALACGWISSVTYVHHPQLFAKNGKLHDIPNCMFRGYDPRCGVLQLKTLPPECLDPITRLTDFTPVSLESEIPIQFIDREDFLADESFPFVFVAHSPNYTPRTADPILDVIRQFIRPVS